MKIEYEELADLLPQKSKMRLIDRIVDCDFENWICESETTISENCIFFDKTLVGVPNYAFLEFAAQTFAAFMGLKMRESNITFKSGFVLSVSNFHFDFDIIKPGSKVVIKTEKESDFGNAISIKADFFISGKKGQGKLTVFHAE